MIKMMLIASSELVMHQERKKGKENC